MGLFNKLFQDWGSVYAKEWEKEREREREGVGLAREAGERTSNLSARSAFKSVWLEMDFEAARSSTLLRGSAATHSPRVHGRTSGLSAMRARPSMRRPRQRPFTNHALVHSQIRVRVWSACGTRVLAVLRTCCDDTHLWVSEWVIETQRTSQTHRGCPIFVSSASERRDARRWVWRAATPNGEQHRRQQ